MRSLSVFSMLVLSIRSVALAADEVPPQAVMAAYESVRAALAKDDLAAVKKSAEVLAKKAAEAKKEALAIPAGEMTGSIDLEKARASFKTVSDAVIPMVKGQKGYYVIACPMAKASWVQTSKEIANPYMGKKMLKCGEIKEGDGHPAVKDGGGGCPAARGDTNCKCSDCHADKK